MKTLLVIFLTIISLQLDAQNNNSEYIMHTNSSTELIYFGKDYVPYLVGSIEFPEYGIETRNCHLDETITLSNGRVIVGLSCIILDKEIYVGGDLIFGGDTTTITDMVVTPDGDGAKFIVNGKDFDMNFTLVNGFILKYEDEYALFNTKGRGIWEIRKKA